MKNILIAPNELKSSLTARKAAEIIQASLAQIDENITSIILPISDGGDGLLDSVKVIFNAEIIKAYVKNPLGETIQASYLYASDKQLAIIEMAEAAGLRLLKPEQYEPMLASSYGVGEIILNALDNGAKKIILGIGGSATNDGGTGLASALGIQFLDNNNNTVNGNAASLKHIHHIDDSQLDSRIADIDWTLICDVDNPLLGPNGAAQIYGPQKGASPEQVEEIESGLSHYLTLLEKFSKREIGTIPGAGAAGGMGAGLLALFNVKMQRGAECILDLLNIDSYLNDANLVVTCEGKLDEQTIFGKAPGAIANRAKKKNIPCAIIAGKVDAHLKTNPAFNFDSAWELCDNDKEIQYCIEHAEELMETTAYKMFNYYRDHMTNTTPHSNNSHNHTFSPVDKCLFPAAGYGTRFLPATKAMPKEILPVMEKPLIQYGVEEAIEAGMHEIAIVTGRGKRAIEDHFDTNYELEHQISGTSKESLLKDIRQIINECTFSYTRQVEMRGLGDAILCGETLIGNEPFGVILADDLCEGTDKSVMKQMADIYEKYRCCIIAIQEVEPDQVSKYGVIEGKKLDDNTYIVSDMVEKPAPEDAPSNLAIIGRYILTPNIFETLKKTPPGKNNELQLTDALNLQAKENMVIAYKFNGKRFDCGSIDGYVEATNYFYGKRKNE